MTVNEADDWNVRPRLGHSAIGVPVLFDAIEEGRPVGSRNVFRSEL